MDTENKDEKSDSKNQFRDDESASDTDSMTNNLSDSDIDPNPYRQANVTYTADSSELNDTNLNENSKNMFHNKHLRQK